MTPSCFDDCKRRKPSEFSENNREMAHPSSLLTPLFNIQAANSYLLSPLLLFPSFHFRANLSSIC